MAGEPGSRFAHFLQPIRDLSKVWKIEIAEELEKYIDELAQISIDNPEEDGAKMNFPEAALLIQGSTAIYSRKVELLYQLVYQALDLISSDKAGGASKKGKAVQSGLWAPIPDTDELLTIDHLIKEGRNIVLDSNAPEQRQAMQRRVPLFLMPRNKEDRQKQEFRIQGCTVHHTGAYLLQESDSKLLDDLLAGDDSMRRSCPEEPLVPAPPSNVQDLDRQLQALLRETDEKSEELVAMNSPAKTPAKTPIAATPNPMSAGRTPLRGMGAQMSAELARRQLAPAGDPWALQDEHETIGQDAPLEVGKTSKRVVAAKKLLMNAEGLPEILAQEPMDDGQLWGGDATAGVAAMATAGDPVESLFLTVAGQLKPGGRYETQRAHFSPAWLEFEDLFSAAHTKWRQLKTASKAPERKGAEEDEEETPGRKKAQESDNEESDAENPAVGTPAKFVPGTPAAGATPNKQLAIADPLEENRKEVAKLESMIADAQQQYEATVRHHLQKMQKDSLDGDSKKFPELYANVRRWQDQLEPVLREFESRPDFHIHEYSLQIIDRLMKEQKDTSGPVLFSKLVEGVPRYEICRRFLTTLFLTNQGNLDIHFDSEAERINGFGVSVLNADKDWISFEGQEAAAPVQDEDQKKAGRAKKAAAAAEAGAVSGEAGVAKAPSKAGRPSKAAKAAAEAAGASEDAAAEEPAPKKSRSSRTKAGA